MAEIHRSRKWAGDARRHQRQVLADRPGTILIDRNADVKTGADRDAQGEGLEMWIPDGTSLMKATARRALAFMACISLPETGPESFQKQCTLGPQRRPCHWERPGI